ncbi:MAG: FtsX-like permease family protein, partial [Vicinamibacterales bacterium]
DQIAIDLRVLAAAGGAAVVTGLFFGLVPAWQSSRVALASSLKDTARSATSARRGWRVALMTSQVGLVGLLLVIATLFVSSFVRVSGADLGFDRHDLVSFGSSDLADRVPEVLAALRATPGVASAAWLSGGEVPLVRAAFQGGSGGTRLRRADGPGDGAGVADTAVNLWSVSPGLFETAGVAILRGRAFRPDDDAGRVVILDETAAARIFADGTDPLGRQVSVGRGAGGARTVVGVARAIRTDGPERPADAQAYYPAVAGSGMPRFLVRTAGPAGDVVPRLQSTVARLLPAGTALPEVRTMDEAFRRLTAGRRFNAGLMSVFGLVALLIGAAGVYAVMSSLVVERRRELGVRLALGATPGRVLGGVLRDAAWYLGLGLAIGLVAGRVVSEVFASLLFGVRPGDLSVYVVVASILATVGLLAALGPARRAARVDPLVTLRAE